LDSCRLPDDILSQKFCLSVPVGGAGGGAGRIRRGFTVEHVVGAVYAKMYGLTQRSFTGLQREKSREDVEPLKKKVERVVTSSKGGNDNCRYQGFGSGSGFDPDPGEQKRPTEVEKILKNLRF
jgi:hypothetical protein